MDPDEIVRDITPHLAQSRREPQRDTLVKLAESEVDVRCWHTPDQEPWATFTVDWHQEHYPLEGRGSGGAYKLLTQLFYQETQRAPRVESVREALDVLSARALFDGEQQQIYLRMAPYGGVIYYDLGDPSWRAVRIAPEGWELVSVPPVAFRRTRGMGVLPEPIPGGRLEQLREVAYLTDDAWVLFRGFLFACLMPEGPYPILEIGGQLGSSKSFLAEIVKAVMDPDSKQPLRRPPKDEESLFVGAVNSRVLAFDNLKSIRDWFSDGLCCLATGGGYRTRQRYTDMEEAVTDACLPVVLNGIADLALNADLQSREIKIMQEAIPDHLRRPIREVRAQLVEIRPRILGALFTAASMALGSTDAPLTLSRMADMDLWIHRGSPALGLELGEFQRVHAESKLETHELAIEASPIGQLVMKLAEQGPWKGTATQLLQRLQNMRPADAPRDPRFPTNAAFLSGALRKIQPPLHQLGVQAVQRREKRPDGSKVKLWLIGQPEKFAQTADPPDPADPAQRSWAENFCKSGPPADPSGPPADPTRLDAGVVDHARAHEDDPWLEEQRILLSLEEHRPIDLEDDDEDGPGGVLPPHGEGPDTPPGGDPRPVLAGPGLDHGGPPAGPAGQLADRAGDKPPAPPLRPYAPGGRPYEVGGPGFANGRWPAKAYWTSPNQVESPAGGSHPGAVHRSRHDGGKTGPSSSPTAETPQEPRKWEPSDPGALITVLGPQGRLWGRTGLQMAETGPSMLTEALGGAAAAGTRQLVLAGGTERTLALPAPDRRLGGALVGSCPALDHARQAGWVITSFERQELRAWSRAEHPRLLGPGRWIDLVILAHDGDMPREMKELPPEQLLEALQLLARLLGTRLATSPAKTWRTMAGNLLGSLEQPRLPTPAVPRWGPDHAMDDIPVWWREPTPEEWARKWAWGFDRSGSWLAAFAGFEVGRGEVLQLEGPEARRRLQQGRLEGYWYVRAPDALHGSPALLERPEGWITDPLLKLLRDTGTPFEVERAEVWTDHHKPFSGIQRKVREARTQLLKRTDPVGVAALEVVKLIYGGGGNSLRYRNAGPDYYRPDLYETLVANARARIHRTLGRATPVGYHSKDSVIVLSDQETALEAAREVGMPFGRQLGSWHDTARVSTRELQDRHRAQPQIPLTRAFVAAVMAGRRRG